MPNNLKTRSVGRERDIEFVVLLYSNAKKKRITLCKMIMGGDYDRYSRKI